MNGDQEPPNGRLLVEVHSGWSIARQRMDNPVHCSIGKRTEFFVRSILDWMFDKDVGRCEAEGLGLTFGRGNELGRGNPNRWNSSILERSDIMRTARGTRPSVG